jgi:hypothetical protein
MNNHNVTPATAELEIVQLESLEALQRDGDHFAWGAVLGFMIACGGV